MNCPVTSPADVNLAQAGQLGNEMLKQLDHVREQDRIHWSEASGCWMVTHHDDLTDALQEQFPLSCKRLEQLCLGAIPVEDRTRLFPNFMRYVPNWIIDMDGEDHSRLRRLLIKALNKKVVDSCRPFVQQRVTELMEQMERQPEVEFAEQIGRQLPGGTILKLLGLPQSYLGKLQGWGNAFQEALARPGVGMDALQRAEDTIAEMNTLFAAEIEKRRQVPSDDLISALVQANEAGDSLSLEEMLGAIQLIIIAGHDTTHNSLSLGLAALAQAPGFWQYMYENPDQTQNCTLEVMRLIAMSASQPRIALEDFEWHGKQIKQGQVVFLMFAAGNRDPRVFSQPESLQCQRPNIDQSLVFAPGMHHCIGHLLGKMQVSEFFGAMVQRFQGAELLDERLDFMPQIAFRGLYKLNVRMIPRPLKDM